MIAIETGRHYGTGRSNAVALNDHGHVVEVHVVEDNLYYRLGQVNFANRTIDWGGPERYGTGGVNAIALDNHDNVVEVHADAGGSYYRVGRVDSVERTIEWGDSTPYVPGGANAIALDDGGNVVEVHARAGDLYYRVGQVNFAKTTIDWGGPERYGSGGHNAIALDDDGNVVEVHARAADLYYRVGKVNFVKRTVDWGEAENYDTGDSNAIALDNHGNAVEVHARDGDLHYRVGKVDLAAKKIAWVGAKYDAGGPNAIALDGYGNVVEVHVGGGNLYCSVGEMATKAFYISSHPDDWIFFRGEVAYCDLRSLPVVLVLTNAGNADCTDGWWELRERAALAALGEATPQVPPEQETVTVEGAEGNQHPIVKYSIGTGGTGMYCMRLPDDWQENTNTLSHLRDWKKGTLQLEAVDHSTTYSSWDDFCATLRRIVETEVGAQSKRRMWINAPLYVSDGFINRGDHFDHTAAGKAVESFGSSLSNLAWWWGYVIREYPECGLNPADESVKRALFKAYRDVVGQGTRDSAQWVNLIPDEWKMWGSKSYSQLAVYPVPGT